MNTTSKIAELIREHAGHDDEREYSPEDRLNDDIGLDSLDGIALVMAIEEDFCIEVPDADLEKWETVGDIIAYVESV